MGSPGLSMKARTSRGVLRTQQRVDDHQLVVAPVRFAVHQRCAGLNRQTHLFGYFPYANHGRSYCMFLRQAVLSTKKRYGAAFASISRGNVEIIDKKRGWAKMSISQMV
jgi:hypothetical protein